MVRALKILGFYAELWSSDAGTPEGNIREFVRAQPGEDDERVSGYLRSGHVLFSAMGVVGDILGSGERILGGDSILTDGEWVWRGDLWFYVSTHHVRLPEEFLTAVRERDYTIPPVDRERLLALTDEIEKVL